MRKLHLLILIFIAACPVMTSIDIKSTRTASEPIKDAMYFIDTLNVRSLIRIDSVMLDLIPPSLGVQFYRDGIVFLSNSKEEDKMLPSHTSFGNIEAYYAACTDTSIGIHNIFSNSFPSEVACDAMTFNNDYSQMYFSRRPSNRSPEKIYQASYQLVKNGKRDWIVAAKPLGFCSDNSNYSHPALTADGEKMIFASNSQGSLGGFDLFITYKEGDDWSTPINLGNKINTSGNETYPFLDQENNLFFSSDGRGGSGGYDIYLSRYTGSGWSQPVNLTQNINTPDDDLAFTLSRVNGELAFFTRNYKTAERSPQLFRVTFRDQYAIKKLTNLSNALKYIAQSGFTPAETNIQATENQAEVIKPEQKPATETVQTQKPQEIKQEPQKPPVEVVSTPSDAIIYRVQFTSSAKSKGSYKINIGGKTYQTFEYLFNAAYRSCAGEFSTPALATNLQTALRREGFPDAFIVAFKNNVRLTGSIQSIIKSQDLAGNKPATEPDQTQKASEIKKEQAKAPIEQTATSGDAVVYRVQFSTSAKPKGSYEITIAGKTYKTFEYLYNGAYRTCVGEFSTTAQAVNLQKAVKQAGYPDAFLVAFKNNVRSIDPTLFK
jgi:LAS superfamily LD-carboxypeptidase LdcB